MIEISLVILAITIGWNQPFRDHVASLLPSARIAPSRLAKMSYLAARASAAASAEGGAPVATPAPRDNSWMWGPTSLDRNAGNGSSRGR